MRNQKLGMALYALTLMMVACGSRGVMAESVELGVLEVRPDEAELRLQDVTTTATVLDAETLERLSAADLADLTGAVPGLTWAGGTSGARYLQMRGIGEVSQFAGEGPPNFSVGLLFDDMDFSGLGLPASLYDIQGIEVLRGPQPAIYGSRAMAGLVSIRSQPPTPYFEGSVRLRAGSDNLRGSSAMVSGPLTANPDVLQLRLVLDWEAQDGYRRNVFLDRRDTNERDERSGRLRLRWQPSQDWRVDLSAIYLDFQNGYDQFSPDNHRRRTYTDRPGEDARKGGGAAVRLHWDGMPLARLLSITSFMDVDNVYSYDADWGHDAFWAADPYFWDPAAEGFAYDFFERLDRRRRNTSQDFRLLSRPGEEILAGRSAWQAGVTGALLQEDDDFDGFRQLQSEYEALSGAVYGLLSTRLHQELTLHSSLRLEQRETDYRDNDGVRASRSDTMWGGRLSLESPVSEHVRMHGAVSRGFKGSGVNQNPALPEESKTYGAEVLWNFEVGAALSLPEQRLHSRLTLFYLLRDNLQIGTSAQFDPADPTAFVYFTDNAARGYNRGVEWSLSHEPHERMVLSGALSLLDSGYEGFTSAGGINQIDGRDQPFAPRYSYHAALLYRLWRALYVQAEIEGRDEIYLAAGHDGQARAYELVHLKAGWDAERWSLTARLRNVFDRAYVVQGYQFGLEPPAFDEKLYVTYGEPFRFDVALDYRF